MNKQDMMSEQQEEIPIAPALDGLEKRQQKLLACRKAVIQEPRNVVLINELGLAAEAAGDFDRARWAYRRATHLDPEYGPAYQNLGYLYRREGRDQPAIDALENCRKYAGRDCDRQAVETALRDLRRVEAAQTPVKESRHFRGFEGINQAPAESELSEAAGEPIIKLPALEQSPLSASDVPQDIINPAITRPMADLGLTPAEALLLLDPEGSKAQEMLRYTALDLVNKQVLEVNDSGQIGRGQNYDTEDLARHERILANYFAHFNLDIDLAHYADAILARLGNRTDTFKASYVRQVLLEKGYMRVENDRWLGFIPVRRYTLTQEGLRALHQLKRQLKNSQSQLRRLMRRDPELAKAYLAKTGPALLLLDNYSEAEFQEWRQILDELGFDEYAGGNLAASVPQRSQDLVDAIIKNLLGE